MAESWSVFTIKMTKYNVENPLLRLTGSSASEKFNRKSQSHPYSTSAGHICRLTDGTLKRTTRHTSVIFSCGL